MMKLMGKLAGLACFAGLAAYVFWPDVGRFSGGLAERWSKIRHGVGETAAKDGPTVAQTRQAVQVAEASRQADPVPASAEKVRSLAAKISAIEAALPALARDRDRARKSCDTNQATEDDRFHGKLRADEAQAIHDMAAKELDDLRVAHRQAVRDDAAIRANARREAMRQWLGDPRGDNP